MTKYKEKGETKEIPQSHACGVCGEQAVIRQGDGVFYCYKHHAQYCRGKSLETLKAEFEAERAMAAQAVKK
jgi:ribosomal protein L37AE/L43A